MCARPALSGVPLRTQNGDVHINMMEQNATLGAQVRGLPVFPQDVAPGGGVDRCVCVCISGSMPV